MIIPWQVKAGLVVAAGVALAVGYGRVEQRGFDRATRERAARDAVAAITGLNHNIATVLKAGTDNNQIEGNYHAQTAPVFTRIVTERVRVGTAICTAAPAAESQSTSSSAAADPGSRVVREDIERDIRALKLAVEEGFATGRACQEKLKAEGLAGE